MIATTIIISSLLCVMIRSPKQNVMSLSEGGSGTVERMANFSPHSDNHNINKRMNYSIPFPRIDRSDYNDPVADFVRKELFHPSLVPTNGIHDFTFPFPTGAFWTNLVLHSTADRSLSYPIAVYPYAYKWSPTLLQVSYPASHRKEEPRMIHDYFFPDLTLSASSNVETEDGMKRHVMAFDPLSVTLRYHNADSSSYWETYLVQGSPYVTVRYQQTIPKIHALSIFRDITCPQQQYGSNSTSASEDHDDSICEYTIDTDDNGMSKVLTGVQFMIQTQEDMAWLIVASKKITLVFDQITRTAVTSDEVFDGVLRIAQIPSVMDVSTTQRADKSPGISRLVKHAAIYPTGGQVRWNFRHGNEAISPRIGTVQFRYSTETFTSASSSSSPEMLMLALPHHAESLPRDMLLVLDKDDFDLEYQCIKGPMTAVLGTTWAYDEVLPTLGFDGDQGSNSMESLSDSSVRSAIIKSLKEDSILALPTLTENVYGFGKQSARLAQMCHICNNLLLHSPEGKQGYERTDLENLLAHLIDLLFSSLESFLSGKAKDFLVYDMNLGGIVSSDGLLNTEADFGNGRYNDHHFHYGYLVSTTEGDMLLLDLENNSFIPHH